MIKKYINKDNYLYRLQQLVILVLHLLLLWWMKYTLFEAGVMTISQTMLHFVGMSIFGALLIRGTAWWAKRHYLKNGGVMLDEN